MPRLICESACRSTRQELDVESGCTLMEAAVENNVPGIVAECGGSCSCATCHVYIAEEWLAALDPPAQEELDLLEFLDGARPNSRLSCQIVVTDGLDGLTLRVPESQG